MSERRRLIAGNWKMNGTRASLAEVDAIIAGAERVHPAVGLVVCPPFTLIESCAQRAAGTRLAVGAQDVHPNPAGAHTGDIAAPMLADLGAAFAIVGHSERRADHGEDDALVRAKAAAACAAGLVAILCVGETERQRDEGATLEVIGRQLEGSVPDVPAERLVIAYEPVWAIGTGRTPTPAEVREVHAHLRQRMGPSVPLLYGGSVKPDNARELLNVEDVDGALVGGASLKAADFLAIAAAG